jgi:starch synthase
LNVLFATAEMSPLAKVGGLGDVAGSLPRALRERGLDVRVAMPLYSTVGRDGLSRIADVEAGWAGGTQPATVWRGDVRGVPVYLVESDRFFGRDNVYGYDDDRDRFLFLCNALLAAAPELGFAPDVVHAQDWHSALLLTRLAAAEHAWAKCGRIYTIHNLALQGPFDGGWARHHGIGDDALRVPGGVDAGLALSAMAQGILHADRVNTVSDTYAREILTPEFGAGLDPLLRARADVVSGIVNGIDYDEFDPQTDTHIPAHYDADSIDGRAANKRALQERAGLPVDDVPLFGVVTRLYAQKGIDLVAQAFEPLLARHPAQLAILGTGDEQTHDALQALERKYPGRVKVWLEFNPPLGQLVYAGCDVFLMPSRYEPCGLGQLISLRYGALPLVRRTGGLSDTVTDVNGALTTGTGFVFDAAEAPALEQACERAIGAYANRDGWRATQQRGMRQDWSWARAAGQYEQLYEQARRDRGAAS